MNRNAHWAAFRARRCAHAIRLWMASTAVLLASSGSSACLLWKDGGLCDNADPGCDTGALVAWAARVAGGSGVATVNPGEVGNLRLWLSADRVAGLADGAALATWSDASGLGNDLAGSGSPTWESTALNGMPAVRFVAASSQYFTRAAVSGFDGKTMALFLVLNWTGTGADSVVFSAGPNPNGKAVFLRGSSGHVTLTKNSVINLLETGYRIETPTGPMILSLAGDATGLMFCYRDGVVQGVTVDGTTFSAGDLFVGARAGPGVFMEGWVAEVVYYDADLSQANREGILCHLSKKYGVPVAPYCL